MSLILGHGIGVRGKILATSSVGVGGKTHVFQLGLVAKKVKKLLR